MPDPFNASTSEDHLAGGGLTLVNGRTFCVADDAGSIIAPWHGTVHEDVRFLSRFTFAVSAADGTVLEARPLRTTLSTPFTAVSVLQLETPGVPHVTGEAVAIHTQWVGRGCRHRLQLRNLTSASVSWTLEVNVDADFAHLFDMKAGAPPGPSAAVTIDDVGLVLSAAGERGQLATRCETVPLWDHVNPAAGRLAWTLECPPKESCVVTLAFEPVADGDPAGLLFALGDDEPVRPAHLPDRNRESPSVETTDGRLAEAFDRALTDLASLRIFDPSEPANVVVAAGAPWFMTLFGRDSLLTAYMALPFAPELAVGVLRALGSLQGEKDDPVTEEEPGKIIHELRRHGGGRAFAARGRYYGTVDATPLYVLLAGEARRWGHLDDEALSWTWPHIVAAVEWTRRAVESGPDGFVSYHRSTDVGLVNQGWKDSWDGVTFADGRLPAGPVALAEVQGYAYAALRAGADLADQVDDGRLEPARLRQMATELRAAFNRRFWMDRVGSYALALDSTGAQIDSVTTNPGHALWCGLADDDLANRYLDRCMEPDMFTGWGLRTLSRRDAAYNPLSYHNGSVWPHDTALVAAGAAAAGRRDVVEVLADAALDAAAYFGGRPPELFAGFDRADIPAPVTYPSSCSPQAWASASILLHLRSLTGLGPRAGSVSADDLGAAGITRLHGVRYGPDTVDLAVRP